jgi:hypothetical protein
MICFGLPLPIGSHLTYGSDTKNIAAGANFVKTKVGSPPSSSGSPPSGSSGASSGESAAEPKGKLGSGKEASGKAGSAKGAAGKMGSGKEASGKSSAKSSAKGKGKAGGKEAEAEAGHEHGAAMRMTEVVDRFTAPAEEEGRVIPLGAAEGNAGLVKLLETLLTKAYEGVGS